MREPIHIAVIDDHPLLREGVVHTLNRAGMEVVGVGASADDAVRIVTERRPDIALLDINMPGGGLAAARTIAVDFPNVKVIILTVSEREDDVIAAMEAGASGYIIKGITGPDLIAALRTIVAGATYITPHIAARVLAKMQHRSRAKNANTTELSHREEQILGQVAQGLTNKEVAYKFALSEKTVKHYMTNVLQKLHVRNRVEAVLAVQKHGRPEAS